MTTATEHLPGCDGSEMDAANFCWICGFYVDDDDEPLTVANLDQWLARAYFGGSSGNGISSGFSLKRGCVHALDPVSLSDGTTVYASSFYNRNRRDFEPDLGIYLDDAWPVLEDGETVHIAWQDYGLPRMSERSILRLAWDAYVTALEGGTVEVACLGSHGRTGTFLALIDLYSQGKHPRGKRAIAQIRNSHCFKCVETDEQERFVSCCASILRRDRRHR
jgi:hypothetical protein